MDLNNRMWLTANEVQCLVKYAKQAITDIVEIGTLHAGGTEVLRQYAPPCIPVWSIDIYLCTKSSDPRQLYCDYLMKYQGVFLIIGDSSAVGVYWSKSVGLLFIDGDHTYEGVRKDFEAWSPWLVPKGFVLIHDAVDSRRTYRAESGSKIGSMPGVIQLVKEVLQEGKWQVVETVDTIVVLQKRG